MIRELSDDERYLVATALKVYASECRDLEGISSAMGGVFEGFASQAEALAELFDANPLSMAEWFKEHGQGAVVEEDWNHDFEHCSICNDRYRDYLSGL